MRTKDEIRAAMRARRRALTAAQRAAASEAVSVALLARADVRTALAAKRPFAVYLAAPHELDLAPFVAALWAADVTVASIHGPAPVRARPTVTSATSRARRGMRA